MGNGCCKPVDEPEGPGELKSLRRPRWKADQPITEEELERMRAQFWDTEPHYGGDRVIWDALKASCEADLDTAKIILDSAVLDMSCSLKGGLGVTVPNLTQQFAQGNLKNNLVKGGRGTMLRQCAGLVRRTMFPALEHASSRQLSRGTVAAMAQVAKAESSTADASVESKAKALEVALKEINSRFGKNSIMKLGANTFSEVHTSPTGALTLDLALGGGYPQGRVVEIYGPESSGKTTLALHAMAEVQKAGGNVALIDAEHAFDPVFAKHLGIDIESLYLCQPDSGEMALEVTDQLIRSSAMDMIAIDSVAALVPRSEIEGEIGQLQVGAQARLMSSALRKIAGNASRHNCTVIFLNQLRHKVGVIYGSPEITSGGQALKYYSSVRLEVRIKERISGNDGQIGIRVKAKCTKNKVAPPYKLAEFDILFGSGISATGCLLDAAEAIEVIQRRGSWYYFGDHKLAQGRDKTLEALKEDPAMKDKIEEQTRAILTGKDINEIYDTGVVDEAAAEGEGVERTKVAEE